MNEMMDNNRWIPLEGAFNVRDLGGYVVPQGQTRRQVLLRGDSLHRLTPEDQRRVLDYGVKTIIDLRHINELQTAPNVFRQHPEVSYHHIPVIRGALPGSSDTPMPPDLGTVYRYFVDHCQDGLGETLVAIAEATEGGLLFHCTAGKDRTGVVAALLLSIAGVAPEVVAEDYALTSIAMQHMRAFLLRQENGQPALDENMLASDAPLMSALLDYITAQYGSMAAYLAALGVSTAYVARIRENFVQPGTQTE